MNKQQIRQLALANGFKLKLQTDGTMDLNTYVYDFADALLQSPADQAKHLCANYCSRYKDEQCSTCMINDEPEKPNTLLCKVAHEAQLIQRMSGIVAAIDSYSCVELANISNRLFLLVDGSHETN